MSYRDRPAAKNPASLAQPVKKAIAARVVAVFNDQSRGLALGSSRSRSYANNRSAFSRSDKSERKSIA
jgi:hypothetical protein